MGSGAVPPQTQEDGLVVTVVLACETKEHLAGGCQGDSSGAPDEELDAELLLEGLDLLGQRRLRDVRVLRGVGEILGSCNRQEVLQLCEVHGHLAFRKNGASGGRSGVLSGRSMPSSQQQALGHDNTGSTSPASAPESYSATRLATTE